MGPERGDRASGRNQLVIREVGEFVLLVAPIGWTLLSKIKVA
jgi:hypothetical protein